jgi:uncharacterized protein
LCFASTVSAQIWSVDQVFNPKTFNNSYVSDAESYIDSITIDEINRECYRIDTTYNIQIAVVVVSSVNEKNALTFATELGNFWGVGSDNRGVIIFVAVADRNMAIAKGEGVDPMISDFETKRIQDEKMGPHFKKEMYGLGLLSGVQEIEVELILSKDEAIENEQRELEYQESMEKTIWKHNQIRIFVLFVLGCLIGTIASIYLKLSSIQIFIISILVGALFTLFNFILINEHNQTEGVFMSIGYLSVCLIPLFLFTFVKISREKRVWSTILVGILYLASLAVLSQYYIMGVRAAVDDYSYLELSFWIEQPIRMGVLLISLFSLFFTYKLMYIYSNSDPYIRYTRLTKYSDYFLSLTPVIFPFPFLTLSMFKKKYETIFKFQPRYSKSTGLLMKLVPSSQEDLFLNDVQEAEEKAESTDYHVWYSGEEGDVLVLQYEISSYSKGKCVRCGEKTIKEVSSNVTKVASLEQSGMLELKVECCNCDYEELIKRIIPQHVAYSSSSSGRSRSYSSSSKSSSSSSSSRSSSGGSWGGGSFGGGGSKSSW